MSDLSTMTRQQRAEWFREEQARIAARRTADFRWFAAKYDPRNTRTARTLAALRILFRGGGHTGTEFSMRKWRPWTKEWIDREIGLDFSAMDAASLQARCYALWRGAK
jgi:hypothetical protein